MNDYFKERADYLEGLYFKASDEAFKYKRMLQDVLEMAIYNCHAITIIQGKDELDLDFESWDIDGDGLVWDEYKEISFKISDLMDPDHFCLTDIKGSWSGGYYITLERV